MADWMQTTLIVGAILFGMGGLLSILPIIGAIEGRKEERYFASRLPAVGGGFVSDVYRIHGGYVVLKRLGSVLKELRGRRVVKAEQFYRGPPTKADAPPCNMYRLELEGGHVVEAEKFVMPSSMHSTGGMNN